MTELANDLKSFQQSHLLIGWDALTPSQQTAFERQLRAIHFAELQALHVKRNDPAAALPGRDRIVPLPVESWDEIPIDSKKIGEEAIASGKLAVLLVAGGQGSRLGFEHPKGMYPIGPVSNATLFQIHAEKVWKLRKKFGGRVPFLIMTSPATHGETVVFFERNHYFDLPKSDVHFFQQGSMPAVDLATGQILLEAPGQLFLSPNGHGGTLTALTDSGLLDRMKGQGVEHVFYFQVDNPLVRVGDPSFLGRHIETKSEASSKVVFKTQPGERVGVLALVDGRCSIIEYSDLPKAMADERDVNGDLAFRAGSPAIHCFRVDFLDRITHGPNQLAYHLARKKVPYYDPATGQTVTPMTENALKFELFVFDALPMADRWLAVEVKREDEFAPLKNATGADSPDEVKKAISALANRWKAGEREISPKRAIEPSDII